MQFIVTIDGTEHEVSSKGIDTVATERKYGSLSAKPAEAGYHMAWHAAKRTELFTGSFEEFLAAVDDVDEVPEAPLETTSTS